MSNMMPFIMSSPPPIDDCEEEDDDEFGDFNAADHNFSITDINQTNDLPEIEKSWAKPADRNEDELPGSSSKDFSTFTPSDTVPDKYVKPFEEHIHVQDSNGFTWETSCSFYNENENSQGDDTMVQPVISTSDLINAQVAKINTNSSIVINEKRNENKKGSLEIAFTEEVDNRVEEADILKSSVGNNIIKVDIRKDNVEPLGVSDDFSDFADFKSGLSNFENVSVKESGGSRESVENFAEAEAEDDFAEFVDFESAVFTSCSAKKEPSVEETLKMMFENPIENASKTTSNTPELSDSLHSCLDDSSSVWGHLKEIETSHALSYQWSNSAANKTLLSSLNIDCRNILFGARWNCCVPRFAANLGVNPLEPVKATETSSLSQVHPASLSTATEEVVPAAQFDWTSSGLTNPLDACHLTLLDLDFFTKFDDISSSPHAASSFWNNSSLEKENATSNAEPSLSAVVDTLGVDSVKPIVDDVFGSICDEVLGKNKDESVEPTVLHPPISSVPDSDPRKKGEMSSESYAIVERLPDLSFLSARKLMHAADENMSRWRLRP